MSDSLSIVKLLTDALPEEAAAREEIIALGIVAGGVIATTPFEGRAELVETFCATLRNQVAGELN